MADESYLIFEKPKVATTPLYHFNTVIQGQYVRIHQDNKGTLSSA